MKKLKINNNWHIDCEDPNNCTLIFTEVRQKKNKDTGEMQDFNYTDSWYYPNVQTALIKYLQLCQEDASSIKECIKITEATIEKIKAMKF